VFEGCVVGHPQRGPSDVRSLGGATEAGTNGRTASRRWHAVCLVAQPMVGAARPGLLTLAFRESERATAARRDAS